MYKKVSLTHTNTQNTQTIPRVNRAFEFSHFFLSLYLTHFLSCSFPFYFSKRVCETKKKEKEKRKKKKERKKEKKKPKEAVLLYL